MEEIKEKINYIKKILLSKGYKMTIQRNEIIKLLLITEKHLMADEMYHELKNKGIGLATIYRNLELFKELNIVREINSIEGRYFELKIFSKKCMDIHFKCSKCGKIEDIYEHDMIYNILNYNRVIENNTGYEIKDVSMIMKGLCNKCRG